MFPLTGRRAAEFTRPRWTTGWYYVHMDATRGTLALTLDRLFLVPLDVPAGGKIDRIGVEVIAAAVGGSARLGVYRCAADGAPASLLHDAGTVDTSTTGTKEASLASALSLPDGRVFLAFAAIGAAATFRTCGTTPDRRVGTLTLAAATAGNGQNAYFSSTSAAASLPRSVTGTLSTGIHGPLVAVRAAA